jgi:hypothetical protein
VLDVNNNLHLQIATRMLEFFYRDVPWNRSLWSPGLRIQLLEVLESSEAVQAGALHTAALQHFCGLVLPLAVNDEGVGDSRAKAVINAALNKQGKLLYHSADYYSLEMLARELGQHYLSRWAKHLRDTPAPSVE